MSSLSFRKFEGINHLRKVAEDAAMTLAHLAVTFTQAHQSITSAIIGPRTLGQLQDTLKGMEIRLSTDILDAIDSIVAPGITLDELEEQKLGKMLAAYFFHEKFRNWTAVML